MAALITSVKLMSITAALSGAGGILALSLFDIPELQSQPGERSLPMLRWLFSRGSHYFPQSAMAAAAGFAILASQNWPSAPRNLTQFYTTSHGLRAGGFLVATGLALAIIPFTRFVMVPNNFALMQKNEEHGGARSAKSAEVARSQRFEPGQRSTADTISGKGEADEFADLSGPQEKTPRPLTKGEDAEVRQMLGKFAAQNIGRVVLLGGSGVLGLLCCLV